MKAQPILPPAQWICACGNQEHTQGSHPDGWEWHGTRLLCRDCVSIAAFSFARNESSDLPPAPIRRDGKPDPATSILLRSGAYLDLADPDCTRIDAVDIAAGLRQFRFAAQTRQAYTVAQHSLLVLQLIEPVARQIGGRSADKLRWCALLHDAPEAFIHDITRPLKGQLPDYKRIEAVFETRFARAFDVRWTDNRHHLVKTADLQALAIEKRDLCPEARDSRPWPIIAGIPAETIASVAFRRVWSPDEAEERFLEAFHRIRPSLPQELAA